MVVDTALFKAFLPHEIAHRGPEVALGVEGVCRSLDDHLARTLAFPHHYPSPSTTASLQRETHTSLPSSSRISTSQTWFVRPTWTGVPMAVRVPLLLGLKWLALISEPTATLPGGQLSQAPTVATDSARTTLAPPCRYPSGWTWRSSTGIVITTLSGSVSVYSIPRSLPKPSFSFNASRSIPCAISPSVG